MGFGLLAEASGGATFKGKSSAPVHDYGPNYICAKGIAPVPAHITPAQLKAALLDLATSGALTDIPSNTVNKMVFNNATSLKFN